MRIKLPYQITTILRIKWKEPYHRSLTGKKFILFSLLAGLFVNLFLIAFQPFGLFYWQNKNKYIILSGFGIVTTLVLLFSYLIIEIWLNKKSWTKAEQAASIFLRTISIGLANALYAFFVGLIEFNLGNAIWFLLITFAVGIFPITGLILSDFFKSKQIYISEKNDNDYKILEFVAENRKEKVFVSVEKLLYITSSDNYCEIVSYDNSIRKQLIRSTLKSLIDQIEYPEIIRCHRSYIVNLSNVEKYEGNSQGIKINFECSQEKIYVSRKYVKKFKEKLKQAIKH